MIEETIAKWHEVLAGKADLDDILADDVAFISPIVFTPQKGKDLTKLYLGAASNTIGGDESQGGGGKKFRYIKQVLDHPHAILEFETEMEGKYVNGIDMITCDDDDRIVEFKVMIRPLQAINLLHKQMAAMIEKITSGQAEGGLSIQK